MGGLIDLLTSVVLGEDDVVRLSEDVYGVRGDDFVAIAWCREDTEKILAGVVPDGARVVEVSEDVMLPNVRSASVDVERIGLEVDGDPVLFRFAQWGGHGGMPPGAGSGIGFGFGSSSPMATPGNFENYMARQQFDQSLDNARHELPENGWRRSMEDRLQSDELYGHQRNERDDNLGPYLKSFDERAKEKRVKYLERLRQFRADRLKPKVSPNSVASIKAMPVDPSYSETMEQKLSERRQNDEAIFRPNFHGPESQFTHFPPPPVKTAARIERRGLTSVFDNPDGNESEAPNPFPARPGIRPEHPRQSTMRGTESGLDGVRPIGSVSGFGDPQVVNPLRHSDIGPGGTQRQESFPYSMRGPQNSPYDTELLHRTYRNGFPDEYHIPLVMNQWPDYANPGDMDIASTVDDQRKGFDRLPPDEQRHIMGLMRRHRFSRDDGDPRNDQDKQTLERRLSRKWRGFQTGAVQPTAYEYQGPTHPWSTVDSAGGVAGGLGRARWSRWY